MQIDIKGFAALEKAFKDLRVDVQENIAFRSVAAGARVFKEQIQLNVRGLGWDSTRVLEENIAILRVKSPTFPELSYEIGVRGTGKRPKEGGEREAPFYWWFHEFGYTLRDGSHKAATPFVTPAIADGGTQARAFEQMAGVLRRAIAKANKQ